MRIAVSGTHCSGKSTLVADFLAAHHDYVHEPEPYEWLEDVAAEPTEDEFYRQLELCVERLRGYGPGANVIAERSPLDFVAYLLALQDLGRSGRDCALIASATELAAAGMAHLDLLVVLPLNGIPAPVSEDLELREAMNERLLDLISKDEHALLAHGRLRVIEVQGGPDQRMRVLEQEIDVDVSGDRR